MINFISTIAVVGVLRAIVSIISPSGGMNGIVDMSANIITFAGIAGSLFKLIFDIL